MGVATPVQAKQLRQMRQERTVLQRLVHNYHQEDEAFRKLSQDLARMNDTIMTLEQMLFLQGLTRYICASCGYSETFLEPVAEFVKNEKLLESLDWQWHDTGPKKGPYR